MKPRLLPGAGDWRSLEDDGQGRSSGRVWISRRLQVGCEAVATQVANVPSVCQAVDVWPFRTGACVRPLRSVMSVFVFRHTGSPMSGPLRVQQVRGPSANANRVELTGYRHPTRLSQKAAPARFSANAFLTPLTAQCCSSRDGTKQTPCHEGTSAWDASCRSLPFSVGSLLLCPSCRASALHTPTSSLGHDLPQLPMPCQPGSTATVAQRTTRGRPRGNSACIITVRASSPSVHSVGWRAPVCTAAESAVGAPRVAGVRWCWWWMRCGR